MTTAKLSSKGQLVIPKEIREKLGIHTGTVIKVVCEDDKIILEPLAPSMTERLKGRFEGADLLAELEREHRRELEREVRS